MILEYDNYICNKYYDEQPSWVKEERLNYSDYFDYVLAFFKRK